MIRSVLWRLGRASVPATVIAGLLLAGCTVATHPADATVYDSWPGCNSFRSQLGPDGGVLPDPTPALGDAGAVPTGFTPVAAADCSIDSRSQPDGSVALALVEQRAGKIDALVAALAQPSLTGHVQACPAVGWTQPWLVLLDARGRWVRPTIPTDECDLPRKTYDDAVRATRFTDRATRVLRTIQSSAAVKTGCDQQTTDMIDFAIAHDETHGLWKTTAWPPGRIRVCRYSVAAGEVGNEKPQADFVSGEVVAGGRRDALLHELAGSRPGTTCTTAVSRFATLTTAARNNAPVYVELTGCLRVYDLQQRTIGTATARPARALR